MEAKQIKTAEDAQTFLEGCVNDLQNGIMTKAEFMNKMADYTIEIACMAQKAIIEKNDKSNKSNVLSLCCNAEFTDELNCSKCGKSMF